MRPLVYYLVENFLPLELVEGSSALDFSAGLGDLSRYMVRAGARSVTATMPESDAREGDQVDWVTGVSAGRIASTLGANQFDLAVARMVFQFPTWEGDAADPDSLAAEFAEILRPNGRLVIAVHDFVPFEEVPAPGPPPTVEEMLAGADPSRAQMIRFLGLPPREGPMGESGFGLKTPMLVTTLQNQGFDIEVADHPEPFTFPLIPDVIHDAEIAHLGAEAMELKRRHLVVSGRSPYELPAAIRAMLIELRSLYRFTTWPVVRIVARRR